jgi:integrase
VSKRGNGEGTIRFDAQRKRWEGRATIAVDRQGQPVRRKVTGKTRAEVVARLRALSDAVDQGRSPVRRDFTVARFLDSWIAEIVPGSVHEATRANYEHIIGLYLVPAIGRRRLGELSPRDVTKMLLDMEARGLSPNTRRLARSVLRRALRYAEAEGIVARNVAAIADGVKLGDQGGRTLTPTDARALLAQVRGHRLEAAFTVALSLGLRRGELLGLAWDDIDLEATPGRLTVRRSLKRISGRGLVLDTTKTRQSRRTVHLPATVTQSLRAHRRRQAEERLLAGPEWETEPLGEDLVFRSVVGTAIDPANFLHTVYSATTAAGLGRWTPHELRHTAASLLLAQGVPLKVISDTLGHSSIRVTADIYAHLMEPAKDEAAVAMEAALWG